MDRSKIVAIITGAISLLLAVGYLILVQLLDFRGEMIPAPIDPGMLTSVVPWIKAISWETVIGYWLLVIGY